MDTGELIRKARKYAGLTQEQLAKKIDVATITIRQYEAGKRQPRLEQLQRIANALGIHILDLVGIGEQLDQYKATVTTKDNTELPVPQDIREVYDSVTEEDRAEFWAAIYNDDSYKAFAAEKKEKPTVLEDSELVDAVIFGRDGKRVKRTYSKEQMDTVYKLLDAIPHKDEEI